MFQTVVATYIMGVLFFAIVFGFTAWKLGGFQAYAEAANKVGGKDIATSNIVQWYVVLFTLLWPFGVGYIALMLWAAKKESGNNGS